VQKQKAHDIYLDDDLGKDDYSEKKNEINKAIIQLKKKLNKDTSCSAEIDRIDECEIRKYLDELLELPDDTVSRQV
jgi:hypothetical protein